MPKPTRHSSPVTILLVDDDPNVRDTVRRMLTNLGYSVVAASNGEEALAHLNVEDVAIDLLLADMRMPGLSGREVAYRARKMRPALKILFLTAFVDDLFSGNQTLEDGMAFLEKPFSARGLEEAIRLLLTGSVRGAPQSPGEAEGPLPLLSETELLRIRFSTGGGARVLVTGSEVGRAEINEIIDALRARSDATAN